MHHKAKCGHIGSSLSCIEILTACFFDLMKPGDEFILSKGHAASALYATLRQAGLLTDDDIATFYQEGTLLAGHPPPNKIKGVRFATGSLGHGLGLAAGMALGAKMRGSDQRIYCVLSDGELNEGSTWEAAMFAAHHKLNNLCVFVDCNGLQGFGRTDDVMRTGWDVERFAAFGLDAAWVDGHSLFELTRKPLECTMPRIYVAGTTKGSGVSFMENKLEWHYLPMSDEQYEQAVREVSA